MTAARWQALKWRHSTSFQQSAVLVRNSAASLRRRRRLSTEPLSRSAVAALPTEKAPALGSRKPQPHCCSRVSLRLPSGSGDRPCIAVNAGGGGGLAKRAPKKGGRGSGEEVDTVGKKVLVGITFGYLGLILFLPAVNVFYQAFKHGFGPFLYHLTDPDFIHAVKLTLLLTIVTVPINTVVGITAALNIVRNEFPGKTLVIAMLDLPFSISPVVTGLMLVLLYGREGWFAPILRATNFNIVFAFPGMAIATLFVTMPFVARELIPVLEAMDMAEEEAALTLGASKQEVFWNVTLPNMRWGLMYGIILTNARAMGEFGAVSVISGNIIGRTQTLTLFVESAYKEYNTEGAFSAAVLLSMMAVGTIFVKDWVEKQSLAEK